jgi:mannose-6-phosphate isomerase-like protein (cupin superfamily)
MKNIIYGAAAAFVVMFGARFMALESSSSATDITATEIDAVRKGAQGDQQLRVVDAGKYNVGVGILRRQQAAAGGTPSAIVHENITEVYLITDGVATMVTGGSSPNAKPLPPDSNIVKVLAGPTSMGGPPEGGHSRKVSKGDIIIIPPGTQHSFSAIEGSIEYLMVRIDPDRVLPAGYVNDIIQKLKK